MIKARRNIETGVIVEKQYPRSDNEPIIDLDDNLEWFDIQTEAKPDYNPYQYNCLPQLNIVDNVCIKRWNLIEKTEPEIVQGLNNAVGEWIDNKYPFWEQNKHSGKALRYANTLILGQTPSEYDLTYIQYITDCADWASQCRVKRDELENEYKTTGVLPEVIFPEKPIKPF